MGDVQPRKRSRRESRIKTVQPVAPPSWDLLAYAVAAVRQSTARHASDYQQSSPASTNRANVSRRCPPDMANPCRNDVQCRKSPCYHNKAMLCSYPVRFLLCSSFAAQVEIPMQVLYTLIKLKGCSPYNSGLCTYHNMDKLYIFTLFQN